jgi:hypothetical protein
MRRGRKPSNELSHRDKKIVKRLNSTPDTMPQLAKKYGISKQRIYQILIRAKRFGYVINRPRLLTRYHRTHQCEVCSKILQFAEKDDLITKRQLSQILNIDYEVCNWHLNQLKLSRFVSKKFATIRSERLAKALQYYKYNSLSPKAVGRVFGYKNFHSILSYHKRNGVDVERTLNSSIATQSKQEDRMIMLPFMSQPHS